MNILDYNNVQHSMLKCDEWYGGGFDYYGPRAAIPKYAKTTDNQTTLSEGFNVHSVTMPNGCTITVHEDGSITKTEANGQPQRIRPKDRVQSALVK